MAAQAVLWLAQWYSPTSDREELRVNIIFKQVFLTLWLELKKWRQYTPSLYLQTYKKRGARRPSHSQQRHQNLCHVPSCSPRHTHSRSTSPTPNKTCNTSSRWVTIPSAFSGLSVLYRISPKSLILHRNIVWPIERKVYE